MFEQILRQYIFIRSVGTHFNRDASGAEKNLSAAFMHHVRVWVCVLVFIIILRGCLYSMIIIEIEIVNLCLWSISARFECSLSRSARVVTIGATASVCGLSYLYARRRRGPQTISIFGMSADGGRRYTEAVIMVMRMHRLPFIYHIYLCVI